MLKSRHILFALCLSIAIPDYAIAGMAVSDAGSYQYMLQQIKAAEEQIDNLKEQLRVANSQLDEAKNIYSSTQDIYSQVSGTYDTATDMIKDLQDLSQDIASDATSVGGFAKKWENIIDGDYSDYINVDDILDDIYKDPRASDSSPWEKIDEIFQNQQEAVKDSIGKCEKAAGGLGDQLGDLAGLSTKIGETESLKESVDLGNRFLAEILRVLEQLYGLYADVEETKALLTYRGVSDETMKKIAANNKSNAEAREANSAVSYENEYLEKEGVGTMDGNLKDFYEKSLNDEGLF